MKHAAALLVTVGLLLFPARTVAHDIPGDVRIQVLLKPEGERLRLLLRVPMAATGDIVWPAVGSLLDFSRVQPVLDEAALGWIARHIDVYEGDRRLGPPRVVDVRVSLPSDTSFDAYDRALAHVTGPRLPADTELVVNQALVDVALEYPIQSDRALFSIEPRFQTALRLRSGQAGVRTVTTLRFLPATGPERVFQLDADRGIVRLEPRWFQAAPLFAEEGVLHILGRPEHLLFVMCLVIPFRRLGALVPIVASFTVAHSVTLIASMYDVAPAALWFPPLVETLLAASIVYVAIENIASTRPRRRWIVAFAFGAVHGFGFSFAFRDRLQFAGDHLLTSLVSFNVGLEIGQLFMLLVLIPVLGVLFRSPVAERMGTIIMSALAVHMAWHWTAERGGQLLRYPLQWPAFDAVFLAFALQWMILAVVLAGAAWLTFGVLERHQAERLTN